MAAAGRSIQSPGKEVAEKYQEILRKERGEILASQVDLENKSQYLLNLTKSENQRAVEKFKQLRQFLEEQEKHLLHEIKEVEKEISRIRDEQLTRLFIKLSSLERSIREMEEKQQKPASELLQDMRSTLLRYEKRESLETPCTFPAQLKWKASRFCDIDRIIENVIKQFRDSPLFRPLIQEANVTLDPDTAHPSLILSEDRKSVRSGDKKQDLLDNPERFSDWPSVLGCEGFTAGRHYWEVIVESGKWLALGVARKSVKRKGILDLTPEGGIWTIENWGGNYWAFTSPYDSPLSQREMPRRIRVTLDYGGGEVSFSDADSGAELNKFSGALFSGETLLPFFLLLDNETHLSIS